MGLYFPPNVNSMSLNNFFDINFSYGLQKTPSGNWQLFNRSYVPLGWHTKTDNGFSSEQIDLVSASYKGLTETLLKGLAVSARSIGYDENGKIFKIFYDK